MSISRGSNPETVANGREGAWVPVVAHLDGGHTYDECVEALVSLRGLCA